MSTREETIFRLRELADALESDETAKKAVVSLVAVVPSGIAAFLFVGNDSRTADLWAATGALHYTMGGLSDEVVEIGLRDDREDG